jgi:pimeloyl-ACP methyl ester carboxylesterase
LIEPINARSGQNGQPPTGHKPGGGAVANAVGMVSRHDGFLSRMVNPTSLPLWLSEADIDFYAGEFARTGFRGGLNWYRNIDRNWELLAPFAGARVTIPGLYIAGDRDLVVAFRGMDQLLPKLANFVPQLRQTIMLPGCGHWTQQECATEVNTAMIMSIEPPSGDHRRRDVAASRWRRRGSR